MLYFACLWTSSSATSSKKWHVLGSLHAYSSCELDHWKCFPIAAGHITIPYLSSIKTLHFSSSLLSFYLSFLLCFYSTVFLHHTRMVLNTDKVKLEVNYWRNRLTLWCLVSCEHQHFCVGSKNYLCLQGSLFLKFKSKCFSFAKFSSEDSIQNEMKSYWLSQGLY